MKFSVPDMSCGHCTAAIEKAIRAADPAATVHTDLGERRVEVGSTLDTEALIAVLDRAGYPAQVAAS